jgi:putative hydrolase of the HAD superfamily
MIKAVLFDFGGVIAEEGFREGLMYIAKQGGLEPDSFFRKADELVSSTGYLTGRTDESVFVEAVRGETGISINDNEFREEILKRFILRPRMLQIADGLKKTGIITAILSDQTEWLDALDEKTPFYDHFQYIFNSFKLHKSKRDPSVFSDVCSRLGLKPDEVLFVDDNHKNIERASGRGLHTIHFRNLPDFEKEIEIYCETS